MSLLADGLQPFLARALVSVAGRQQVLALPDVIVLPTAGYRLSFNNRAATLEFDDPAPLASALAADCSRLALASFQTASLVTRSFLDRDDVVWGFLKLYYAAFYAGHTLIRLFGEGCSYLGVQHARRLTELGVVYGAPSDFSVEAGLYHCILSGDSTSMSCTKVRSGAGGAHEVFWSILASRIQEVSNSVLDGSLLRSEAQAVFVQLDAFRRMASRNGNQSWLSAVRNDLQYRHQFGVWFPAQKRTRDREALSRLALEWRKDPMEIRLNQNSNDKLHEFVICCGFLISLCRVLLLRIAERSTAGRRSFVYAGPIAYLNDRKLMA